MPSLIKLLRKRPVTEDPKDIAVFINRELMPFLQELRDSLGSDLEQIPTDTLLGRDEDGTGPVENISLDDTLEFTGSRVIRRAEITGDVEIPAGSNASTIPAFATGFVVQGSTGFLPNEYVGTTSAQIAWDFSVPGQVTLSIVPGSVGLDDLEDIPDKTVLGNDTGGDAPPEPITVHQELDWIGGEVSWIFDGTDDRIDFGNNFSKERTDAFSMSLWFNTTTTTASVMMGKNLSAGTSRQGYTLNVQSTGRISWALANNSSGAANVLQVETNSSYNDGTLRHVVVTYDGSSSGAGVQFYINGATVAQSTLISTLSATTISAAIYTLGARDGTNSAPYAGTLAHASLWNRVLTAPEVVEVYNGGIPPDLNAISFASALQHWAALDEVDTTGAGGVSDRSASNIDGTAEGGLTPTSLIGGIPTRGTTFWQLIAPSAAGLPLCSNGANTVSSYQRVPLSGIATVTGPTILGLQTGTATVDTLTGAEAGHLIKKSVDITASVTSSQNNWAPANLATADHIFVSPSADWNISGIDGSTFAELDGTEFVLWVTSAFSVTLLHNSGLSTSGNRFQTPGGLSYRIGQLEAALIRRNGNFWYVLPLAGQLPGNIMGDRIRYDDHIFPPAIAAQADNYSPTGLSTAHVIAITLTGSQTMTGLDDTVFDFAGMTAEGKCLIIRNDDTVDTLTLAHQSASSTATNRFICRNAVDCKLPPGWSAYLSYASGRWYVMPWPDMSGADDSFPANVTGAAGAYTAKTFSSTAGGHLTYDATNHRFDLANVAVGTQKGRQVDAGSSGAVVDLTGAEQGENIRFATIVNNVEGSSLNNYAPSGFDGDITRIIRVDPSADINLTGVAEPTVSDDGCVAIFIKGGTSNYVDITNDDASSSANNQFSTVGSVTIRHRNEDSNSGWLRRSNKWQQLWWNPGLFSTDSPGFVTASGSSTSILQGDNTWITIQQLIGLLGTARAGNQIVHNGVNWILVDELLTEEFYTFSSASQEGEWNWFAPFGGAFGVKRVANRPGVVTVACTPGGPYANFASTTPDGSSDRGEFLAEDIAFFRVILRLVAGVDQCNFGIGLCYYDSSSGSAEFTGTPNMNGEGIILLKRSGNTLWRAYREDAGTGTDSSTGVTAVADEWVEAVFIQTSAGTWDVYLNGALTNTGLTGGPQGSQLLPAVWQNNLHATDNRDYDVDLFQVGLRFSSPRYD